MLPNTGSAASAWAAATRTEIDDVAETDGSVAVVPVGSVEQHGNHLPVGTDSLLADAVSNEGCSRADAPGLVTPVVWLGNSPHHVSLGGTITTDPDGLRAQLHDVADSVFDAGFDGILFVNGHGGNASIISTAVSSVGSTHPEREVTGLTYFQLAAPFINEIRESEPGGMAHAGEFETALMRYLYPEHVGDETDAEYMDDPYEWGLVDLTESGPLSSYRPFEDYSGSGAIGDPDLGTAEKGEALFDRLSDELGSVIEAVHEQAATRSP